jgi:hypothetical protein
VAPAAVARRHVPSLTGSGAETHSADPVVAPHEHTAAREVTLSTDRFTARTLREGDFTGWTRLVELSADGNVYGLPRYLELLCAAAGGRFSVVAVQHGDEVVAGVALYETDSMLGPWVAPRPLLYYNGVVVRTHETRYPSERTSRDLKALSALVTEIDARGLGRVSLRCASSFREARPFLEAGWTSTVTYSYCVRIDDLEAAWSRVEHNLRRLVGRGERDGLWLAADEDFDAFYRLHADTMGRKGAEPYLPEAAFRRFVSALAAEGLGRLFHARAADGRVVASQLVLLGPGRASHTVAAATDPEHQRTGASAFLRWRAFEALAKGGYATNDLTDAALNPVTHFKSQLGGELQMSLVLEAPRTLRFRAGEALRRAGQTVRRRG